MYYLWFLKSNLDIHGGNQAISQGGSPSGILSNPNPPYDGGAFLAQGDEVGVNDYDHDWMRDDGNLDSPFSYKKGIFWSCKKTSNYW